MSDYIDRQAAIDATWEDPSYTDPLNILTEVRDRIERLPSAEVIEVVRCQNCKYWDTTGQYDTTLSNYHYCPLVDRACGGDFYCAEAERK